MRIRAKLTLLFTIIVATILTLFSFSIYYFSTNFWEDQFYSRLKDRAITTAKLLIEVKEVDMNLLRIIDKNTLLLPEEQIIIYNDNDEVIYNSREKKEPGYEKSFLDEIKQNNEIHVIKDSKKILGISYSDALNRFIIIASGTDIYGDSKLRYLGIVLIIGFFIAIALTAFAGLFFSGQVFNPISNVIKQVSEITATKLDSRVEEGNRKDEIALLAITFNKMLQRLEDAFKMQKSFVSNASHELRTPLTSITGQIDVALMKNRDVEEYKSILLSILDDIHKLNRLTNGLLDLAYTNQDISEIKLSNTRIDELILTAQQEVQKAHNDYNINIDFSNFPDDEEMLIYYCNEQLILTAFKNLIDNACKYSSDKSVKIIVKFNPEGIFINFIDFGIGISEDELDNIYQPFYRGKNVKKAKGHGLGLPLAYKIITLHKGRLIISSKVNEGTNVQVILPKK